MKKRVAVISNGAMGFDCIKLLNENNKCELQLVFSNTKSIDAGIEKRINNFCANNSIKYVCAPNLNTKDIEAIIKNLNLDYIFNIDSFEIIKPMIFNLAKNGTINFHNSPLPQYRGANSPSWAIFNDEKEFGVTWHIVDEGIDTGDILWQKMFFVRENETARSLIFKCIEAGINLFKENISDLFDGKSVIKKQSENGRTYYRKNTPNNGYINFQWTSRQIGCMVRALDFRPFNNTFAHAKIRIDDQDYIVHKASELDYSHETAKPAPGSIIRITNNGVVFSSGDGAVLIENICDINGNPVKINSLNFNKLNNFDFDSKNVA